MSGKDSRRKKNVLEVTSWKQKKEKADMDEESIKKEVKELISWTTMMESMNEEQLKEYLLSRPKTGQTSKTVKILQGKKTRRSVKARSTASASLGIMASVWKFHKEEDDDTALSIPA